MTLEREAFLGGYLAEAEEHVASATRHLLTIAGAGGSAQPRALRELFRSLHTIKGLSAMVGIEPIVDLAHGMEAVLRAAERSGGRLAATTVDLLSEGVRAVEQRLRLVADGKPVPPAPVALIDAMAQVDSPAGPGLRAVLPLDPELADKLTAIENQQIAEGLERGMRCVRLDFVPSAERAAAGVNITAVRERVARVAELVRVIPRSVPVSPGMPGGIAFVLIALHDGDPGELAAAASLAPEEVQVLASPAPASRFDDLEADDPSAPGEARGRHVRVEVSRLDDALERLSGLLVTRFRLGRAVNELAGRGVDVRELTQIVNETSRHLRDLRAAIMRARMVSVTELLERVPLTVRGLSRATGKPVRVEIDAGRAELDKAVGERIFPAVVHIIRNAVDHGIEAPDERRRRGKPAEGVIRVSCFERSNSQLELAITDDGAGVDREAVARRAGRSVPESDEELLELLATPGLSTTETATTTSGRGLGVDIVHRIVRDLGGELHLRSRPGEGTTFLLRVPLSITIVDAFSFQCAGQVYVVPVATVDEIVEVDPQHATTGPQRADARAEVRLLSRRGAAVPLVRLAEAFALSGEVAGLAAGVHPKAIVVRRAGAPYAFQVDRMLGQQEVVVRPVDDPLVRVTGVSGSTDLGDGRPVLVLDLVALCGELGLGMRRVAPEVLS